MIMPRASPKNRPRATLSVAPLSSGADGRGAMATTSMSPASTASAIRARWKSPRSSSPMLASASTRRLSRISSSAIAGRIAIEAPASALEIIEGLEPLVAARRCGC